MSEYQILLESIHWMKIENVRYNLPIFMAPTYVSGIFLRDAIFHINEQVKTNISAKFDAFNRYANVPTIILLINVRGK